MNINLIKLLVFTLLVGGVCYVIGYTFLSAFRAKIRAIHCLVSPVLGLALLSVQLWIYGIIGVSWNRWLILAPWAFLLIMTRSKVSAMLPKARNIRDSVSNFKQMDLLSKTLLVLSILFWLAFTISLALQPITTSDVLAIWGYKAKEFFFHQQVYVNPQLYVTVNSARFFHVDYPPLSPLTADVFYVLLGHINDSLLKLLQSLFIFSGAATLFLFVKDAVGSKRVGLQVAMIATFLLIAAPQFLPMLFNVQYMGYADYPLAIFMLISVIFLARYLSEKTPGDWWLSLTFASFAAVTKNEGLTFLVIMAVVLLIIKILPMIQRHQFKKIAIVAAGSLIVILPTVLWTTYKQMHGLTVDFKFSNLNASGLTPLGRLHLIVNFIWLYIRTNPAFHWELAALLLATVATLVRRSRIALIVCLIIWSQLGSFVISYLFSPYETKFHVLSSIDRLMTQVLPLVILLLAISLISTKTSKRPKP